MSGSGEGSISFRLDNYESLDELLKYVSTAVSVLVKEDYIIKFYYEDCGIYVLEYGYNPDEGMGTDVLMWVTSDEAERIENERKEK